MYIVYVYRVYISYEYVLDCDTIPIVYWHCWEGTQVDKNVEGIANVALLPETA